MAGRCSALSLENPMDKRRPGGLWVHGVTQSWTRLNDLPHSAQTCNNLFWRVKSSVSGDRVLHWAGSPRPFTRFKRTQGSSQFAKSGAWTRCEYLSIPKGNQEHQANWEQSRYYSEEQAVDFTCIFMRPLLRLMSLEHRIQSGYTAEFRGRAALISLMLLGNISELI